MRNLDYGVIGNCKSAALISKEGTIEWCCLPNFNSPAVFAKILDRGRGGEFGIGVTPDYAITQSRQAHR
jgi:alpha,alpha-trehalase